MGEALWRDGRVSGEGEQIELDISSLKQEDIEKAAQSADKTLKQTKC